MVKIDIRYPLKHFNLNEMIRQREKNRYNAGSLKKDLEADLYFIIRPPMKKRLSGAYEVEAHWLISGGARDIDNLMLKSRFDCMQSGGMLIEDNYNHIVKITHTFEKVKPKDQGVIVTFKEVDSEE